jgi:hypothetical protein
LFATWGECLTYLACELREAPRRGQGHRVRAGCRHANGADSLRQVGGTVFDLLGDKENDITYSLGWTLAESERLSSALLEDVVPALPEGLTAESVRLQEGISGAGFTDIEILASKGGVHVVIEAKRGYDLPQLAQLQRYPSRTQPPSNPLVVCAEASADFVAGKLPGAVTEVPVLYRSWREIETLVSSAASVSAIPPREPA